MKKKGKLTKAERLEIAILKEKQYSLRRIAGVMERSPNTISYEVKVNSINGEYNPHKAHIKAQVRQEIPSFSIQQDREVPRDKADHH